MNKKNPSKHKTPTSGDLSKHKALKLAEAKKQQEEAVRKEQERLKNIKSTFNVKNKSKSKGRRSEDASKKNTLRKSLIRNERKLTDINEESDRYSSVVKSKLSLKKPKGSLEKSHITKKSRISRSENAGDLDTYDVGFIGNFPYPEIAVGVEMYGGGVQAIETALRTHLTAVSGTNPEEKGNIDKGTFTVKHFVTKGPYANTHTYRPTHKRDEGNTKKYQYIFNHYATVEENDVYQSYVLNKSGALYADEIKQRGKFPFVVNLGKRHFISVVLYKKPQTDNIWNIAVADSMNPSAKGKVSQDILNYFMYQGDFTSMLFANDINIQDAKYFPCVRQEGLNCLLNAIINCDGSEVDREGNITFPGTEGNSMKPEDVEQQARQLREYADDYKKADVTTMEAEMKRQAIQRRQEITEKYDSYHKKNAFQEVLSRLALDSHIRKRMTQDDVKAFFEKASGKDEISRKKDSDSIIHKEDHEEGEQEFSKIERRFSSLLNQYSVERRLFPDPTKPTIGLRSSGVKNFTEALGINLDKAIKNAGFVETLKKKPEQKGKNI